MPPAFLKALSRKRLYEGSTLSFVAEVVGVPKPGVKWYHNKSLREVEGEKHVNISFDVFAEPSQEEWVEFRAEDSESCSFEFQEGGKAPVFLKQVSDVEVWQGDVARLSVTVTGSPTPKIQWFFNGMKLTPSMDRKLVFAGNDHSLILPYAGVQDEGDYTCVASNVHGKTTCSAHLHVRQRIPGLPCFSREPDSVRCAPGFTAVFEYTVAGEPCPDVQWFKGSDQIFSDARHSVARHADGSGSLTVRECMEEDTGLYTCRAVSTLGEATCSAELLVLPEEEHAVCRGAPFSLDLWSPFTTLQSL
uniref:Ig-like domain-containing protein n=1 Tax=Accipiter nisus TaxID=211598 RepID=A0A8B9MQP9_9AVES